MHFLIFMFFKNVYLIKKKINNNNKIFQQKLKKILRGCFICFYFFVTKIL